MNILENFNKNINSFYDLAGTIELRKDNLNEALQYFNKVDQEYWSSVESYNYYLKENPFHFKTNSPYSPDYIYKPDSLFSN